MYWVVGFAAKSALQWYLYDSMCHHFPNLAPFSGRLDSFEEFGSTFGLIMMFRRMVFSLGFYLLFFPFPYSADLFLSTWYYATGGSFWLGGSDARWRWSPESGSSYNGTNTKSTTGINHSEDNSHPSPMAVELHKYYFWYIWPVFLLTYMYFPCSERVLIHLYQVQNTHSRRLEVYLFPDTWVAFPDAYQAKDWFPFKNRRIPHLSEQYPGTDISFPEI